MDVDALTPIFRRRRVRFAYLWGSRAAGRDRADSDYDFAVGFRPGRNRGRDHTLLWRDLVLKLGTDAIDLVDLDEAGVTVRYTVQRKGRLVFESDPAARIAFAGRARREGWDEARRWSRQARALMRRLKDGTFGR